MPELAPDDGVGLAVDGSLHVGPLGQDTLMGDQGLRQGLLTKLDGAVNDLMQVLNSLGREPSISLGVYLRQLEEGRVGQWRIGPWCGLSCRGGA